MDELTAALLVAFCTLVALLVGLWFGHRFGRRQGVADIDPERLGEAIYSSLVPRGVPWNSLSRPTRDMYVDHADDVIDNLIGDQP